jgi:hypothetical protein
VAGADWAGDRLGDGEHSLEGHLKDCGFQVDRQGSLQAVAAVRIHTVQARAAGGPPSYYHDSGER